MIAPVQAFIIKDLLLQGAPNTWRDITSDKQDALLVKAALEIISQAADDPPYYSLVHIVHGDDGDEDDNDGDGDGDGDGDADREREEIEPHERDSEYFHSRLRIVETRSLDDVEKWLTSRIYMFKEQFGVLLLLYTVVCTKGLEGMTNEMSDPTEPAIDSTYGYGSQSLINLMLTGRAVGHVWDHDQNVGGLGISFFYFIFTLHRSNSPKGQ